jgi:putative glycosyltransferase (TIGR04372 family)
VTVRTAGLEQRFLINREVRGAPRQEQLRLNRRHRRITRWMAFVCLPLVVFARLIRPIVLVRFGRILRHKIGHCPLEAEMYLLERAAGLQPRRSVDFLYFDYGTDGLSANLFADHLVRRNLRMSRWAEWAARANEMLPKPEPHRATVAFRDQQEFAETRRLLAKIPQQIDLTAEEEALGRSLLGKMGVPPDRPFICVHVREAAYWQTRKEGIDDSSDFRNSRIENYFEAMLAAADRGYFVLRLGAGAAQPLPDLHPNIIDYATKHRTEFMDVFLAFRCSLMVSTGSGIDSLSYLSRRPMVLVNLVTWGAAFVGMPQPNITLFKNFRRGGRLMTFAEVLAENAQEYNVSSAFSDAGITLEENTPDEIAAAVIQMLDRLEGRELPTDHDRVLQEKMRAHIARSRRYRDWQFEVGADYLRRYEALL